MRLANICAFWVRLRVSSRSNVLCQKVSTLWAMAYAATVIITRKEKKEIRNTESHDIRPRGVPPSVVTVALGVSDSVAIASEGHRKQHFLFHIVGFRRTGGRAGTGRPPHRQHGALARQAA